MYLPILADRAPVLGSNRGLPIITPGTAVGIGFEHIVVAGPVAGVGPVYPNGVGPCDGFGVGPCDGFGVGPCDGFGVGPCDGFGVGPCDGFGVGTFKHLGI
jgi:hypothetical protein